MLDELQNLAAIASSEPEISVIRGEPGCPWSFHWETRIIRANPEDLRLRPPDYCRGLILHESAHAAITRICDVVPGDWLRRRHPLLNAVEDCRIETWLMARLPGCQPWVRLYNDHLFGTCSASTAQRVASDPAAAFLSGILDRWWNPQPILRLHPLAATALDHIWPHFQSAVAAYPAARAEVPPDTLSRYAAHPVALCYLAADRQHPPTPPECEIRMRQHQMWNITFHHIVPAFLELLEHPGSEPTRLSIEREPIRIPLFSHAIRTNPSFSPPNGRRGPQITSTLPEAYLKARASHSRTIEACAETLLRFLTAESRPATTRFHRSGQRLDLRVAMQFEADPRLHDRLWQRTTLPVHPDPAFVVAVDASGSMCGRKATATFESLVILRETCLRLSIPLAILAFHSEAVLLQSLENPQQPSVASLLTGLLNPSGPTDLSPALTLASGILTTCPHRHRHLWILSDGVTSRPGHARHLLRAIRADGTRIHGVGLGPDSEPIAHLIPGSPTQLQPHQLPETFASLLKGSIRQSVTPS